MRQSEKERSRFLLSRITILFEDEEVSEQYGNQVNIGVIDCPLSKISELDGDYDVRIELAE